MENFKRTKEAEKLAELIHSFKSGAMLDINLIEALEYVTTLYHDDQLGNLINVIQKEFPEYGRCR